MSAFNRYSKNIYSMSKHIFYKSSHDLAIGQPHHMFLFACPLYSSHTGILSLARKVSHLGIIQRLSLLPGMFFSQFLVEVTSFYPSLVAYKWLSQVPWPDQLYRLVPLLCYSEKLIYFIFFILFITSVTHINVLFMYHPLYSLIYASCRE